MLNESIKMALQGMVSNKLRTFLTLLGIIIGVGAVIAMVSLGFGLGVSFFAGRAFLAGA